jgi:hypothetical protein
MTPEEEKILEHLVREISDIKGKLPNGEITILIKSLNDVKEDLSEIKYILLNPETGVIVKTNKNTEFRVLEETRRNSEIELINKLREEVNKFKDWKSTVSKALWIIFMTIVGLTVNVISGILGN